MNLAVVTWLNACPREDNSMTWLTLRSVATTQPKRYFGEEIQSADVEQYLFEQNVNQMTIILQIVPTTSSP